MENGLPLADSTGLVGKRAPDFTLQTDGDEVWRLSDQIGNVTVLLFYPQNETVVCTRQLCSVRDNWTHYLKTKAAIVGISPGTLGEHKAFSLNRQLPIPLLADPNRKITLAYSKHWLYPVSFTRAVVVIDAEGIVRTRSVMMRAFRPSDEEIITAIYAARGDALKDRYDELRTRASKALSR